MIVLIDLMPCKHRTLHLDRDLLRANSEFVLTYPLIQHYPLIMEEYSEYSWQHSYEYLALDLMIE